MKPIEKISKILRTDKNVILSYVKKAEQVSSKTGVLERIIEENEVLIKNRFQFKQDQDEIYAEEIYNALISKIKEDDLSLFKALGKPSFMIKEDIDKVLEKVSLLTPEFEGFFLKEEKAREFLKNFPPEKVINYLNYRNVDELLEREDVYEIYAAIRLFEDMDWFNSVFVRQYEKLTPDDFEKRKIKMASLSEKWVGAAQSFLKKKYQNISHLKELGFIFVMPVELGILGETTRMFSLALHYFNEIKFFSELFDEFKNEADFGKKVAQVLKGEEVKKRLPESNNIQLLILPRYLAKYDEYDWRLSTPHISPEALFWQEAEEQLLGISKLFDEVYVNFMFWQNLDWVGDFFKTSSGFEVLVSFNLVDAIMSLIREKELEKYLYHHQESLWNKIFTEFFSEEKLKELIKKDFIKGYTEIKV